MHANSFCSEQMHDRTQDRTDGGKDVCLLIHDIIDAVRSKDSRLLDTKDTWHRGYMPQKDAGRVGNLLFGFSCELLVF